MRPTIVPRTGPDAGPAFSPKALSGRVLAGVLVLAGTALGAATGCATGDHPGLAGNQQHQTRGTAIQAERTADRSAVVAYVDGTAIRRSALWPGLVEAAGQTVLDEVVLDRLLTERFAAQGRTLTGADVAAELSALSESLSDDPDEAARLLNELRRRRGLGDDRFDRLLRRNAMLRQLVADEVAVSDAQAQRLYDRRYGPRYRVRLFTADSARAAQRLRARALAGEPFGELAARHSTDASAAQGGLLSPISPLDPTYPQAVRDALPKLDPATERGLSPVIALEGGFAVLKLEEVQEAQAVPFEEVKENLRRAARRQGERLRMEQLANALREGADVLVLDPALK